MTLQDELNIACNNFRAEYHQVIKGSDFNTFEELEDLVLEYDMCRRQPAYRPPPAPRDCVLPEYAYHEMRYVTNKSRKYEVAEVATNTQGAMKNEEKRNAETLVSSEVKKPNSPLSNNNEKSIAGVSCFNCGKPGHRFRKCTAPRVIFCFKCEQRDVKTPECSKCSRTRVINEEKDATQGNENREMNQQVRASLVNLKGPNARLFQLHRVVSMKY